jgi:hypothetical protein
MSSDVPVLTLEPTGTLADHMPYVTQVHVMTRSAASCHACRERYQHCSLY